MDDDCDPLEATILLDGQDCESGLLTVKPESRGVLLSMSDYGKPQEAYVYGTLRPI